MYFDVERYPGGWARVVVVVEEGQVSEVPLEVFARKVKEVLEGLTQEERLAFLREVLGGREGGSRVVFVPGKNKNRVQNAGRTTPQSSAKIEASAKEVRALEKGGFVPKGG